MDAGAIPPPPLPSSHRSHVSTPAVGSPESDIEIVFEGIELWTKRYRHAVAKIRALKRGPDFENALRGLKSEQADIWKTLKGKKKAAKALIEALGTVDRREYYNGELEELRVIYLKVEGQYWAALAVVDPTSVTDARDTGRLADRPDMAADAPLLSGGLAATPSLPPPTTADGHVAAVRREVETYKRVVAAFKALPYDDDFADAATPLLSERAEALLAYNERREAARAFIAGLRDPRPFFERELAHVQDLFREEDNAFWTARRAAARAILLDGTLALGSGAPGHGSGGAAGARGRPTNTTLLASALATERRTTKALLEACRTLQGTHEVAIQVAETIVNNGVTLKTVDAGLDEVDSELTVSRQAITVLMKRLYTDKVILALGALLILGVIGLIVYAVLNPSQQLVNIPTS